MASSSNINPYDNYESSRIEQDVIDPDDLDVDDDDPLEATSATTPLNPTHLTSVIPGEDRRAPNNTLDESVWDTLSRDVFAVWEKMKAVLWPKFTFKKWPDANDVLESGGGFGNGGGRGAAVIGDWDLWGPLVFCLALSTLLSFSAGEKQTTQVFAGVFSMVWVGEAVVTAQIKLLGGNISFFQSVSIIGYTLFPIVICAFLSALHIPAIVRVPVYSALYLWTLAAGVSILGGSGVVRNRVGLAVFPLGIFYAGLVCLCLVS